MHFYAANLTAVEVNYTFRTLPSAPQLRGWLEATPPGFQFSFKAPQRITHFARLRDCAEELDRFLTVLRPAAEAGKLGPLLFQLPPNFKAEPARLALFLQSPVLASPRSPRVAFEFRHDSWFSAETFDVLREHNAALCVADTDDLQTPEVTTADFTCYRLRRDGGYSPDELQVFAERFTRNADQADTYVFFRHQDEPTGALNATFMLQAASQPAKSSKSASGEDGNT